MDTDLVLRPATIADRETLFAWRNDASTRSMSHDRAKVDWAEHCRWLEARLARTQPDLYMVESGPAIVATFRIDDGTISYTVAPEYRNMGVAKAMLQRAVREFGPLRAEIFSSNIASRKAAEEAGLTVDILERTFCVASVRPWNIAVFHERISNLPGRWHLISEKQNLTLDHLSDIRPDAIFFPHWNWKVPSEILDAYACVAFHAADLPFGRGGSPIQNLITLGHTDTKISALRMTDELDAGPIYLKKSLSLAGPAHEIFRRVAATVADMIKDMICNWPEPVPQEGHVTYFTRRTPLQSEIPSAPYDHTAIYDHIRMLDAPGYPNAFLEVGELRIEFRNGLVDGECVNATAKISQRRKRE